jgi:exodeoxyribonuclease VII large subunit
MFTPGFLAGAAKTVLYHRAMADETPGAQSTQTTQSNLREYSVSELANELKRAVEDAFPYVRVRGEISGLKFNSSGHVYFDLKDDKALLNAVIWRTTAQRMKLRPEQGLEVICTGRISTFPGSSRYQIIVDRMELAGLGALMAMLEARKKKLAALGLFDAARKKRIPFLPRTIGVVTSPTGAVIRDIIHRLADRCPRRVLLWPVAVQGERAPAEIAAAIRGLNALPRTGAFARPDVIIVARGGGSFEDLLAFSDEEVVRAAAESAIPLISGVGHETDTTLIDLAADKRAPTPTAAAEMAVPVLRDLVETLLSHQRRALRASSRLMDSRRRHLQGLGRALPRADSLFALPRQRFDNAGSRMRGALFQNLQRHRSSFLQAAALLRPRVVASEFAACRDNLSKLDDRLLRAYGHRVRRAGECLESCGRVLESLSYRSILERGFALVRSPLGELRRQSVEVVPGERLALIFADGETRAIATKDKPIRRPKPGQADFFE